MADTNAEKNVNISEDVLGTISCIAALEADGVYALSGNITRDKASKLNSHNCGSCVKITNEDDTVTVSLSAEIEFGYKAAEVAETVQSKVKQAIESMTDCTVAKVNVYFAGIHIDSKRP